MSYERVKKCRLLNKDSDSENSEEENIDLVHDTEIDNSEVVLPSYKTEFFVEFEAQKLENTDEEEEESSGEYSNAAGSSSDDFVPAAPNDNNLDSLTNGHLEFKIKNWVLRNIKTLTQKSIDEILIILRSEGYTLLPKSSKTLLGTSNISGESKVMKSSDDTLGEFQYFGVKENLNSIIDPNIYKEDGIELLIHIDGMDVFNKSKKGFWSILGKVFSTKYISKPFLIALYYGNSKPYSAREFLEELVFECNILTNEGINVNGKIMRFKILAFCCDMPARAFIKCCKSHTGFFSCERCVVRGETVNNKRIFKETKCEERTLESFRNKTNPEHHLKKENSPLLDIIDFDPIKFVVLDEMHMLYLGVTKYLIQKFIFKNSNSFILEENVGNLQKNLTNISKDITVEFQRKSFDLMDLTNWKATQFRFFLLYAGAIVLRDVLEAERYKHFLLLYTACRILSSTKLATLKSFYVKKILKIFVDLMPNFYGPCSQIMNIHNLIHIADDIINIGAPISQFSAFDFENSLGYIKSILKSPTNPISQIQRKLHVFHSNSSPINIPLLYPLSRYSKYSLGNIVGSSESQVLFSFVNIHGFKITATHPDNVCLMSDGNIMVVKEIFSLKQSKYKCDDLFVKGNIFIEQDDLFTYPLPSREIGLYNVKNKGENVIINIRMVEFKCILTVFQSKTIVISLLHK